MRKYEIYEKNTDNLLYTGVGDSGLAVLEFFQKKLQDDCNYDLKTAIHRTKMQIIRNRKCRLGAKLLKKIKSDYEPYNKGRWYWSRTVNFKDLKDFTECRMKLMKNKDDVRALEMHCHDIGLMKKYEYTSSFGLTGINRIMSDFRSTKSHRFFTYGSLRELNREKVFLEVKNDK